MAHVHYHNNPHLDQAGMGVSAACFVHCVAGSVITAVPGLLGTLGTVVPWLERLEVIFLLSAVVLGFLSLWQSRRMHATHTPLVLFACGVAFWALRFMIAPTLEFVLTMSGSFCVAAAHFVNLRRSRCHVSHAPAKHA